MSDVAHGPLVCLESARYVTLSSYVYNNFVSFLEQLKYR